MRPNGTAAISLLALTVAGFETWCLLSGDHDQLFTRVIARWRRTHPWLVDSVIVYLAAHLLDRVPCDPLRATRRPW